MFENKIVLIAEDTEFNYILLKSMIERYKVKVIWAQDGKQAVEIFKSNTNIDLIFMDIRMPNMDGYEATKAIRQFNKEIPIIAQTAFALDEEQQKIDNAGFTMLIHKPIRSEQLLELLTKFCA